mmetsp:Transcript_4147/g.6115  ORF Transcript_4147/g.6115 Transcript_4147/m.6115 type:complete len:394 (+) Transcript_4147:131-1312(+)
MSKAVVNEVCVLDCPVQNYAWGKIGSTSAVALLSGKTVDEKKPYAELWMGTHHKGPAKVIIDGKSQLLSESIGSELPYLFKVLSVAKALSIQAHPDKKLAQKLHKERPHIYKDPNHKPEMTCAVTNFEAMCGFRPSKEIADYLDSFPEFRALVGEQVANSFCKAVCGEGEEKLKAELKLLFSTVAESKKEDVAEQVAAMVKRISGQSKTTDVEKLIIRLNTQYPADVGVFAPLFLNYLILKPGEAMFLGANEPHAYLSGDCIECMACSDNVVRAGLTPKLRDTPTLCSMLTYKAMKPSIMKGNAIDNISRMYTCPIDEFELTVSNIPANTTYSLPPVPADALILVYDGSGTVSNKEENASLKKGSVLYVKGKSSVKFETSSSMTLYRCSTAST